LKALSWLLCGLTVVSDWIGSNRSWFPYCPPDQSLEQYWDYAKGKARDAIQRAGVVPSVLSANMSPQQLYPEFAASLSPLQKHVRDMPLADGPSLTIIEDVTGSGKTEAAMLLAARLMGQGLANGLFFALPTMATANAMYERLEHSYERLFAEGARPSLVLAHGKRTLNARFTSSILPTDGAGEGYDDAGAATCAAWIADDRRKVFLAQIGVGTIDQALLGVLPSRHQVLRLWGLSDRVLIIDEAHAYDAYMSKELERQLEFQAALGGSAIVLSATLPERQRQSLSAAFAKGLGANPSMSQARDYPLVTHVGFGMASSQPVPSRADRRRTLPVRRIASFEDAASHVSNMAEAGCAVAWIRNSVDDAIEAVEDLRRRGHPPVLLHARFAMGDRLDIEEEVRAALGRQDKAGKRRGFLVVGTQILEQSLDYDVDVMVADLAPVDSLIQRAGRLWRHARRERPVAAPEFCVLSPDPEGEVARDWYRDMSARAAAVYGHHGSVWRSAKALFDQGVIETPNGVRALIEAVYGSTPDDLDDIPEALHAASRKAIGTDSAARSFANASLLDVASGYGGNLHVWTTDTITPTRLGEPQTVFRLGRIEGDRIVPWYTDENVTRAWALSEVSVSRKKATGVPDPGPVRAALMVAVKRDWPKWEQETPLLVLEPDGEVWHGIAHKIGEGDRAVVYDRATGLSIT
jgi:CRISPR-associated endonuclease/helicase Cas3